MGVDGQCHILVALQPGMTWYSLYRGLGGPLGWSGQVQKVSLPPGFDLRTVQPVAICYTNYTITAHARKCTSEQNFPSKWTIQI